MEQGEFISITELGEIMDELDKLTPEERVDYFRAPEEFFLWWFYYYPESFNCDLAEFHFAWMYFFSYTDLNLLIE